MRIYSFCRCSGVVRQQMVKLGLDFRDWGLHSWGFWAVERFAPAPRPKKTQETQAETSLRQSLVHRAEPQEGGSWPLTWSVGW